jgi:hypothetical protein
MPRGAKVCPFLLAWYPVRSSQRSVILLGTRLGPQVEADFLTRLASPVFAVVNPEDADLLRPGSAGSGHAIVD